MIELDRQLRLIGELPSDPRLATMGPRVIAAAAGRRARRMARSRMALAASLALVVGVVGSLDPVAARGNTRDALTGVPSLAPSTLLAG